MTFLLNEYQILLMLSYTRLIINLNEQYHFNFILYIVLYLIINLQIFMPFHHFLMIILKLVIHLLILLPSFFLMLINNILIFIHSSIQKLIIYFLHLFMYVTKSNGQNQIQLNLILIHWYQQVKLVIIQINSFITTISYISYNWIYF